MFFNFPFFNFPPPVESSYVSPIAENTGLKENNLN